MNDDIAIKVDNVSKSFRLPHEKQNSIKGSLISMVRGGKRSYEKQQVLKDVSFEIKKGEFFGIVGRNGSGKSTLLKMLAGIYTPSKGQIHINGKLTPFIELGVGFNPELTGRENVFLNGALLGFNRQEMLAMYDDIVEFAELERFMDQKLKNYSSGMQVRLAFSIAIRAQSDILVLDEVLAVGDEAFQQKCVDVFEAYKANKQTIVLVTHDMATVKRFCSRAILVNDGNIIVEGNPNKVAAAYSELNNELIERALSANESDESKQISIKLFDTNNKATTVFSTYDTAKLQVSWPDSIKNVEKIHNVGIAIYKNTGEYVFGDNTFANPQTINHNSISYSVDLAIGEGKYHFIAGLFGDTPQEAILFSNGPGFTITKNESEQVEGIARLKSSWRKS